MTLYAIYSEKQAAMAGVVEYVDIGGNKVRCTAIEEDAPGCPASNFDDKIDLGEVVEYVRRVTWPIAFRRDLKRIDHEI